MPGAFVEIEARGAEEHRNELLDSARPKFTPPHQLDRVFIPANADYVCSIGCGHDL